MTPDERAEDRFYTAQPRGLTNTIANYYPKSHDNLVGSVGEGNDKNTVSTSSPDPIVSGTPTDSAPPPGGNIAVILVKDGVLYNATISGTLGDPV